MHDPPPRQVADDLARLTLAGILVRQGAIGVADPGAIAEWRGSEDARAGITLDDLLRMTSGLEITEDQTGADPNSWMLFAAADGAAYAAGRPQQALPGAHYEYMSGSTVLAMRRLGEAMGATLQERWEFVHRELFDPLGLGTAVIEPDQAGTFIGSSFMLASARDWAQLGQLYVNDGVWNGRRILPEGWREYVSEHTPQSGGAGYGAGFWLGGLDGAPRFGEVIPADAITMNGWQGQYVMAIPSLDLVIVRLGATVWDTRITALAEDVIGALKP